MIVISGVLLLVAVVCLVIGLFSSLAWVYISITVSVVSFVFLLLGVRQRKDLPALAGAGAGVPAVEPAGAGRIRAALGADDSDVTLVTPRAAAPSAAGAPVAGDVLVVPGRPRYHVTGCRYLSGREPEARTVAEARAEGFTACGVCRPDDVLAGAVAPAPSAQPAPVSVADPVEESGAVAKPAATKPTATSPGVTRPATAAPTKSAAKAVQAKVTPAKAAPAKAAPAKAAPAKRTAAASSARTETVVVIPDRDKFHRDDCRYVRGVDGTQQIAKAKARRDGYQPCGVCKP